MAIDWQRSGDDDSLRHTCTIAYDTYQQRVLRYGITRTWRSLYTARRGSGSVGAGDLLATSLRLAVTNGLSTARSAGLGGIALADLEKQLIQQALEQAHRNKSLAAKLLGMSRTQLRARLRYYGLETD